MAVITVLVHTTRTVPSDAEGADRARSATEAFLYRRLETLSETKGRFRVNVMLPIAFDSLGSLEVDLLCADARAAVQLDGAQHLADPVAYRRDRRKEVLRFLAEDVARELDLVLDSISKAAALLKSLSAANEGGARGTTLGSDGRGFLKQWIGRAGSFGP